MKASEFSAKIVSGLKGRAKPMTQGQAGPPERTKEFGTADILAVAESILATEKKIHQQEMNKLNAPLAPGQAIVSNTPAAPAAAPSVAGVAPAAPVAAQQVVSAAPAAPAVAPGVAAAPQANPNPAAVVKPAPTQTQVTQAPQTPPPQQRTNT